MKIIELVKKLENLAPIKYAEEYDNVGLLTGNSNDEVTGVLCTLDCTEAVVDEAIQTNCNLIVAHHPIIFKGLKKITGQNYVQRTIINAIKGNIAIYAIHTNLDNAQNGVNNYFANTIGLVNKKVLQPLNHSLFKLIVFIPKDHLSVVENAMFNAGAGNIGNYSEVSFYTEGNGNFKGNENANPAMGKKLTRHTEPEYKTEVIVPSHLLQNVVNAMVKAHPYEEVAYDCIALSNKNYSLGAGVVGELPNAMEVKQLFDVLKSKLNCTIRHSPICKNKVKQVALCGGSGSFLLNDAIKAEADVFITSDFKYHEFFDADNQIIIADVGHFESEQFTRNLLADYIQNCIKNIATFAVRLSEVNTNPINYY